MKLQQLNIFGAKTPAKPAEQAERLCCAYSEQSKPEPDCGSCASCQCEDKDISKYVFLCFCDDDYDPIIFRNEKDAQDWILDNCFGYDDDEDLVGEDQAATRENLRAYFDANGWDTSDYHCWYGRYEVN